MAMIKKFFERKKLDAKFKLAGEGHKLTDDTRTHVVSPGAKPPTPTSSQPMTVEKRMAADAAVNRMMNQSKGGVSKPGSTHKDKVRQEKLMEQRAMEKAEADAASYAAGPKEVKLEGHPAVGAVLFRCPMAGPEALPKEMMEAHIEAFLMSQLADEPEMTSALIIQTLNKNTEAVKQCIDTLGKYLENIAEHPGEEKYQRIRCSNKVLSERVLTIRGADEFLRAAGFERKVVPSSDGTGEEFLILSPDKGGDIERLRWLKEILQEAEPIRPELDRNVRVFSPSSKEAKIRVPDEFYAVSAEEIKREMEIRREAVEKFGMLRTKEMREKDRVRELRRYRYCLIRVRFPDGVLLQGTFRATEKLFAVQTFVSESLEHDWIPFTLSNQLSAKPLDDSLTLAELDLAPASLLQFTCDAKVLAEAQHQGLVVSSYLNKELMSTITEL